MVQTPDRLVIRTYAPLQRRLLVGGLVLLGALMLYVAWQWGRQGAGPAARIAATERDRLREEVRALQAENKTLRLQAAAQETARVAQARERTEVARTIGELQARVARQEQDLAFYRGIVGDTAQAPPVRVQQFRVVPLGTPGRFQVRFVLGRPVRPEDVVAGTIGLGVEGVAAAGPATLDLAAVTEPSLRELRFSYRYLQSFEQEVVLPAGFRAERVTLEVRVARKGVEPVRQTFLWTLDPT